MSGKGQFQSSHAFTRINTSGIESINPNTGSLNVRIPLVKLVGIRPSIDLNITLFYTPGSQGIFGLPNNWSLDIPYVLDGKSLTTGGRTYAIDLDWPNGKEHKTGLRYVNNNGITFKRQLPPKPFPSGRKGTYAWYHTHPDGSVDYFDELGRPGERHDIYGNHICYEYQPPAQGGSDLRTCRLKYIHDSWGQLVEFYYKPSEQMRVKFPDNGQSLINFSAGGIGSFVDAEDLKTKFEYALLGRGQSQIHSITYPNGLISTYKYISLAYIATDGSRGGIPAVQEHTQRDSDGHLLARTRYKYGPKDGCTFTGAAINLRMGGATDSVMDADSAYKYEVQKSSFDKGDNELSRTGTWFNSLHLPTRTTRYSRMGSESFKEAQVTRLEYPNSSDHRARSAAYDLPILTETLASTGDGEPKLIPLQRITSKNNDFCLPVSSSAELYGAEDGYVKQTTVSNEYKKTSVGTMIAIRTSQKDEISHFEQILENKLTADEKDIASSSTTFIEVPDSPAKPWKLKSFEYDECGRVVTERVSWMSDADASEGSAKLSTTSTAYQYNGGKLTVTKSHSFGNATTSERDVSKVDGPVVRTRLPLGETEVFEFDKLGREISHVDALGNKGVTVYTTGPRGTSSQTISPLGYMHTTTLDVLGRETETSDNGDETSGSPASRVLSAKVYDFQSRVVEEVDKLGLRTIYKYDDLDRPTEITDANNNAVSYDYLNGGLQVKQALNGDQRSLIYMNGRSKPIAMIRYPDSEDKTIGYSIKEEHRYDGRGNVISKAWSQVYHDGKSSLVEEEVTKFSVEGTILSQTTTGHTDAGDDKVQRQFTYDLFGNVYTYVKDTWYADGNHLTHQGPVDIYDEGNRLAISRNQEGQEERREYDRNSRLRRLIRLDGSDVQYEYDSVGRLKTTRYPLSGTSKRSYDADGRQVEISQDGQSVNYGYSLDGSEISVQYADGRSQTRTFDKYSRIVREQDVHGSITETTFDDLGNVSRRSCQGDTIEYSYGLANHTKGQLLSTQQSGQGSQSTTYSYDGLGRVRRTTVKESSSGKVLLDTTQTHDFKGRLQRITTVSELVPDLEGERVFEYDGIGQLIKDARSGETGSSSLTEVTAYTYDGNSNVVKADVNGRTSTMSFNKIDQRTDSGFEYDVNGRLVRDNNGCEYKFDDRDRLISVTEKKETEALAAGTTSTYSYSPSDYLSGYKDDSQNVSMYFNGGVANAMSISASDQHSTKASEGASAEKKEDASIFSDSGNGTPLCTITRKKTSSTDGSQEAETRFLLNQLGSTVAVFSKPASGESSGKPTYIAKSYDAYGAARRVSRSSSPVGGASSFLGFTSEFSSPKTSIVYLRARQYHPVLRTFLSMDPRRSLSSPASSSPTDKDHNGGSGSTVVTENRYAYCGGDPLNRIDPTGRSWGWLKDHSVLTLGLGLVVGIAVGAGVGLAVEAGIGALSLALTGEAGIAATLGVSASTGAVVSEFVVGATSGVVGGFAGRLATGDYHVEDGYTWGAVGLDALGGGLGSTTAYFARPHIRKLFNSPRMQWTLRGPRLRGLAKWGGRKGVGALVNNGTKQGLRAVDRVAGFIGIGLAISLEDAVSWADQVVTMEREGARNMVAYRGKSTTYEKCGLGYGG